MGNGREMGGEWEHGGKGWEKGVVAEKGIVAEKGGERNGNWINGMRIIAGWQECYMYIVVDYINYFLIESIKRITDVIWTNMEQ